MSKSFNRKSGLVLVGYRGTGKSTVGRIVAERLDRGFDDADLVIESRAGTSIRDMFERHGEAFFRDWEERVIADLTSVPGRVIATGGGAVLRESNRSAMKRYGLVVWLTASVDVLRARLEAEPRSLSGRPSLTPLGTLDEIARVLDVRLPHYKEVSDVRFPTDDQTPSEVAEKLLAWLAFGPFDFRGTPS